ncbi:MAG: hypothetical protein JRN53_04045 [Nitrososphaerota archaeon]|nr:hypothetical protein [Nitrososphaerota archaeon]
MAKKQSKGSDETYVRPSLVFMFDLHQKLTYGKGSDAGSSSFNQERLNELNNVELHVLGEKYFKAERLKRRYISKFTLPEAGNDKAQAYSAEVYLVTHREDVEIIEVWIEMPEQEFDPKGLLGLLKPDSKSGVVKEIQRSLPYLDNEEPLFTFIGISGSDMDVDEFVNKHGADIVDLLYLNSSPVPFKDSFIDSEVNRNFCIRKGGASYMSGVAALNLMFMDTKEKASDDDNTRLQGKCALPFIIIIELLLLEREILRKYYRKLATGSLSINGLIGLKQEILNGLEEYYGIIARATQFSEPLMEFGQRIFGTNDLYDSIIDRLDAVVFDITTNYSRNSNTLSFWLTVLFGSLDTGLLTESIVSIYYIHNLPTIIGWTAIVTVLTSLTIYLLLYRKIR